jgi:hypothetical protein
LFLSTFCFGRFFALGSGHPVTLVLQNVDRWVNSNDYTIVAGVLWAVRLANSVAQKCGMQRYSIHLVYTIPWPFWCPFLRLPRHSKEWWLNKNIYCHPPWSASMKTWSSLVPKKARKFAQSERSPSRWSNVKRALFWKPTCFRNCCTVSLTR